MRKDSKVTEKFLDVLEEIVSDDFFFIYTNRELVNTINEKMGEEYISYDTLKSYLFGRRGKGAHDYERLVRIVNKALLKQKKQLTEKLYSEEKSWQRFAWLLERKFEDFNKIEKAENENNHKGEITITRKTIK